VAAALTSEAGGPSQPLQVVQAVRIGPEPGLELADGSRIVRASARVIDPGSLHGPPVKWISPTRLFQVGGEHFPIDDNVVDHQHGGPRSIHADPPSKKRIGDEASEVEDVTVGVGAPDAATAENQSSRSLSSIAKNSSSESISVPSSRAFLAFVELDFGLAITR